MQLKEEEYDKALDTLTNDVRYQLHLTLYRRLDTIWTLLSTVLCILVPTLLANFELPVLLGAGALWIVSIAFGALVINRTRKNVCIVLKSHPTPMRSEFIQITNSVHLYLLDFTSWILCSSDLLRKRTVFSWTTT